MRLAKFVALVEALKVSKADVKKWRTDLRRMTKIYRDIKVPDRSRWDLNYALETGRISDAEHARGIKELEAAEAKFLEAEKLFRTFRNNFNAWVNQVVLLATDSDHPEPYTAQEVRSKVHQAIGAVGDHRMFPYSYSSATDGDVIDVAKLDRQRKTNITRYQKAFNAAFKALDDHIAAESRRKYDEEHIKKPDFDIHDPKREDQELERYPEIEKVQLGPVNLVLHNKGRNLYDRDHDFPRFAKTLRAQVDKIVKAGFKPAVDRLTVHIGFESKQGLVAGQYFANKDELWVYPLGWVMGDKGPSSTFIHEVGHRFYFRNLPGQARKRWEQVFSQRQVPITEDDIQTFHKVVIKPKKLVYRDDIKKEVKRKATDEVQLSKFRYLADHTPGYTRELDEMLKHHLEHSKGDRVNIEEISDYGATDAWEAFAEAFQLFVIHGPRKIGPWTLNFLKAVSRGGGARFASMRVSDMIQAATPLVTVPYLKKLSKISEDGTKFWPGTKNAVDSALRDLTNEFSGIQPYPVDELWETLVFKGALEEDVAELKNVKIPRGPAKKKAKRLEPFEALQAIEKAGGKSVIDGVRWDQWPDTTKTIKAWAKALETLKKYKRAFKLYQKKVKKIRVRDPRGTEEANWDEGYGILNLTIPKGPTRMTDARWNLVHEMGHALEDFFDAMEIANAYGQPPYVSPNAGANSSEDFAETFRALEMEPALLKRKAPDKYADMLRRVKEKL